MYEKISIRQYFKLMKPFRWNLLTTILLLLSSPFVIAFNIYSGIYCDEFIWEAIFLALTLLMLHNVISLVKQLRRFHTIIMETHTKRVLMDAISYSLNEAVKLCKDMMARQKEKDSE